MLIVMKNIIIVIWRLIGIIYALLKHKYPI